MEPEIREVTVAVGLQLVDGPAVNRTTRNVALEHFAQGVNACAEAEL
jgi:hypothetical protein